MLSIFAVEKKGERANNEVTITKSVEVGQI